MLFVLHCLFIFSVENHFIDNEQEVLEFINSSGCVRHSTAFLMDMTSNDLEQDCTGVVGSSSMFEFR